MNNKEKTIAGSNILTQNKNSWNVIADDWFGTTALPEYGCLIPKETELNLFGDVKGKKMLDIGCGSGHSLLYHGQSGADELWGLDISEKQLKNADKLLCEHGYKSELFCSPMEANPGIPENYFDFVYSIYAIGWTTNMALTFTLVAAYLKQGGSFIFSWDHPFMHCISPQDEKYVLDGGYFDDNLISFKKGGQPVSLYNRKISDYINALFQAGFVVENMIEKTENAILAREHEFSSNYYSPSKAKLIPLSFIIKAKKL